MSRFILVIAFFLALVTFTGCISEQDYQAAMGEGAEVVATLREEAERHEAERVALQAQLANAEGEAREALAAQIAAHERLAEELMKRSDQVNQVLVAAKAAWERGQTEGPSGVVEEVGAVVLPFLPPGAQGPGVLVLGIAGVLARLAQRSKVIKGLVNSIDTAKQASPEFAKVFKANSNVIEKAQPLAARKAVVAVQEKRLLPI